jgi:hypothetical protein
MIVVRLRAPIVAWLIPATALSVKHQKLRNSQYVPVAQASVTAMKALSVQASTVLLLTVFVRVRAKTTPQLVVRTSALSSQAAASVFRQLLSATLHA